MITTCPAATGLPTCGLNGGNFQQWESAGCLCAQENTTRCFGGFFSTVDSSVVSSRPLAVWNLANSHNVTVLDSSGNGHHGTVMGAVVGLLQIQPDLTFNGSSIFADYGSYIDFGNDSALNFGAEDFLIQFALLVSANHSGQDEAVMHKGNWSVFLHSGALLFLSPFPNVYLVADPRIDDDKWRVVQIVRSTDTLAFYFDGVQAGVGTLPPASTHGLFTSDSPFIVGGVYFKGGLANISIHIGSPTQQLCHVNSTAGGYVASATLQSMVCSQLIGLCAPTKHGARCCGVSGCAECDKDYTSCSATSNSMTATKASTSVDSVIARTSSVTTNAMMLMTSTASVIAVTSGTTAFAAANVSALSTDIWIIIVVVIAIIYLVIGLLIACVIYWRARRTNQDESARNNVAVNDAVNDGDDVSMCSAVYGMFPLMYCLNEIVLMILASPAQMS
jgi:hypothetical protein